MVLTGTQSARFSIVVVELAGREAVNAGILLEDPSTDRLWIRLRRDWYEIAPGEAEVLAELEDDLFLKAREMGAERLLQTIEDSWSNIVRVTDRRQVMVDDFERTLARLYREHVRSTVIEFERTCPATRLPSQRERFWKTVKS